MISKRDITKIAKKVLKRQKGLQDHQIIHPQREWTVGLLGGIILLTIGGAWSVVTYQDVSDRAVENTETAEIRQTTYRDDVVDSALKELQERQDRYQQMIEEFKVSTPVEPEVVDEEEIVEVAQESEETPVEQQTEELEVGVPGEVFEEEANNQQE